MPRKKKAYPPARTSRRPPDAGGPPQETTYQRPSVVAINLTAGEGREGITIGSRVRITGTGLYSGEAATVESLPGGVIPAALVRTDAGRTRRVRTIDLEPITEPDASATGEQRREQTADSA